MAGGKSSEEAVNPSTCIFIRRYHFDAINYAFRDSLRANLINESADSTMKSYARNFDPIVAVKSDTPDTDILLYKPEFIKKFISLCFFLPGIGDMTPVSKKTTTTSIYGSTKTQADKQTKCILIKHGWSAYGPDKVHTLDSGESKVHHLLGTLAYTYMINNNKNKCGDGTKFLPSELGSKNVLNKVFNISTTTQHLKLAFQEFIKVENDRWAIIANSYNEGTDIKKAVKHMSDKDCDKYYDDTVNSIARESVNLRITNSDPVHTTFLQGRSITMADYAAMNLSHKSSKAKPTYDDNVINSIIMAYKAITVPSSPSLTKTFVNKNYAALKCQLDGAESMRSVYPLIKFIFDKDNVLLTPISSTMETIGTMSTYAPSRGDLSYTRTLQIPPSNSTSVAQPLATPQKSILSAPTLPTLPTITKQNSHQTHVRTNAPVITTQVKTIPRISMTSTEVKIDVPKIPSVTTNVDSSRSVAPNIPDLGDTIDEDAFDE